MSFLHCWPSFFSPLKLYHLSSVPYVGANQTNLHNQDKYLGKEVSVHQPGAFITTIVLGSMATKITQRHWTIWTGAEAAHQIHSQWLPFELQKPVIGAESLTIKYILELHDVMFAVACLKSLHKDFDIRNFIKFSSQRTRSSSQSKLVHQQANSKRSRHFYFNRIPRLFNSLPLIDLELTYETIKHHLRNHLWDHFIRNFDSHRSCTFHYVCACVSCSQFFHSPTV